MTPEAQNAAIAKAINWNGVSNQWWCPQCKKGVIGDYVTFDERHDERSGGCGASVYSEEPMPLFTEDLNACHAMEEHLSDREKEFYAAILDGDTFPDDGRYIGYIELPPMAIFTDFIHITASQRCEAFLKVKNLWKD